MPPPTDDPYTIIVTVTPRLSTLRTKGTITYKRFQDEIYAPHGDLDFLATPSVPTQYNTGISLACLADINIDYDTGIINCSDPRAFISKNLFK